MIENATNLQGLVVGMKQPSELMQSKVTPDYAAQAAGEEHIYTRNSSLDFVWESPRLKLHRQLWGETSNFVN